MIVPFSARAGVTATFAQRWTTSLTASLTVKPPRTDNKVSKPHCKVNYAFLALLLIYDSPRFGRHSARLDRHESRACPGNRGPLWRACRRPSAVSGNYVLTKTMSSPFAYSANRTWTRSAASPRMAPLIFRCSVWSPLRAGRPMTRGLSGGSARQGLFSAPAGHGVDRGLREERIYGHGTSGKGGLISGRRRELNHLSGHRLPPEDSQGSRVKAGSRSWRGDQVILLDCGQHSHDPTVKTFRVRANDVIKVGERIF